MARPMTCDQPYHISISCFIIWVWELPSQAREVCDDQARFFLYSVHPGTSKYLKCMMPLWNALPSFLLVQTSLLRNNFLADNSPSTYYFILISVSYQNEGSSHHAWSNYHQPGDQAFAAMSLTNENYDM